MQLREHLNTSGEIKDIVIADLVLTFAFAFTLIGGIGYLRDSYLTFIYFIPIAFVAVSLSFVLHEMMHKFVAQKFGAIAAFKMSQSGLIITIITSLLGFLIGIPGATVIYTNNFTKREDGIVSLAGPLTNFCVFLALFAIGYIAFPHFVNNIISIFGPNYPKLNYFQNMINFALFISLFLAFFNMLPVYPLDGSKVLRWNPVIFFAVMAVIFLLMLLFLPLESLIGTMVILLIITLFINLFYRGIGLF
jgi:Zn-dependent protease